jgi:DGQHR domain-containing protein
MGKEPARVLRRRALLLEQSPDHPIYQLSLTGEEIQAIADISRVSRDDAGKLIGYQREEVRRHVEEIANYLNSDAVIFPNSIILAISSDVRFIKSRGPQIDDGPSAIGTLEIMIPRAGEQKPAWVVDGQQRSLALLKARDKSLRVPVNAFVADDVELQREQFLRVNNTKPLPRGLITELLPEVGGILPSRLAARQMPSKLTEQLNLQKDSPFLGMVRRASSDRDRQGVITDTSLVAALTESLNQPTGSLFPYRNLATGETDIDAIWAIVTTYWRAVSQVFPEAWGKPPARSRLMHGVGIRAMGRLMDRVMPTIDARDPKAVQHVMRELEVVVPICHWTDGVWDELGGLSWDALQNVPKHIRALSSLLIRTYVQAGTARR